MVGLIVGLVAWTAVFWLSRVAVGRGLGSAVDGVTDPRTLEFLALNAPDELLRSAAVGQTSQDDVLGAVALSDPSSDIREAAVRRIRSQNHVRDIVERSSVEAIPHETVSSAIRRLEDVGVMVSLVHAHPDESVKEALVKRIDDQTELHRLATSALSRRGYTA
jgi:hypothetical protein